MPPRMPDACGTPERGTGILARVRCLSAATGNKPAALRAVHGQDGRATSDAGGTPAPR
ncbi:hypothetical protein OPIT5_28640 [Opitutaceae bacterium TAV5]|nr:hypothetical protein OPIT5_28640 [Opitutaceae bacterium TAV5]